MRTSSTILSTIVTADTTDASLLSLWTDAVTRAENGAAAREWVIYSAVTTGGRKQADLAHLPVGKGGREVGKTQVNNYVKHWEMWADLGLDSDEGRITLAWSAVTGSRGWFAKRSTDEYKTLRDLVVAETDQDKKVALLLGTDLPEKAPVTPAEALLATLKRAAAIGQGEDSEPLVLTAEQAREVGDFLAVIAQNAVAATADAKVPATV